MASPSADGAETVLGPLRQMNRYRPGWMTVGAERAGRPATVRAMFESLLFTVACARLPLIWRWFAHTPGYLMTRGSLLRGLGAGCCALRERMGYLDCIQQCQVRDNAVAYQILAETRRLVSPYNWYSSFALLRGSSLPCGANDGTEADVDGDASADTGAADKVAPQARFPRTASLL